MTTLTYAAALIIQKTWRGHILYSKALPVYALAQARSLKDMERKIHDRPFKSDW